MRWLSMFTFIIVVLAGCGTVATPRYVADTMIRNAQGTATAIIGQAYTEAYASPKMTATPTSTSTPKPTETNTPIPSNTPALTPTEPPTATSAEESSGSADTPADASERVAKADAANGEVLFNTFQPAASFGCFTCHHVDSEDRLIGPGLLNIGVRAEGRVDGLDATQYIYQSIVNPSAYVVDGFPDQLMPQNWAEIYSDAEVYDIIAYLLTLQG